jgi:hypothetical protein
MENSTFRFYNVYRKCGEILYYMIKPEVYDVKSCYVLRCELFIADNHHIYYHI